MAISNIDELLTTGQTSTQQPATPEHKESESVEDIESDAPDYGEESDSDPDVSSDNESDNDDEPEPKSRETDEYGNEQEPENKEIRERLKKQARKYEVEIDSLRQQLSQQGASQPVQQAAKDFEYDPDAKGDWQQQLAQFVKQTVNSMSRETAEQEHRHQEAVAQQEFESRFREGVNKFDDFRDVITSLPFEISNPMTLATRAMTDPAAFLYAAAKRQPQELERISKLRDPYVQMTEMGKLEERMRKNKPTTKAPRPLGRTQEDAHVPGKKKEVDKGIDDLLAKADAKRLEKIKTRIKGNR